MTEMSDVCMSDELCIDEVPNFINNDKSSSIIVYVGIGSALPYEKVTDRNHHQYPPCLKNIKDKHVGSKIYLVLIDPEMEAIPYVAKEYKMEKFENYENIWTNKENGMTVISIKKAVTYHLAVDSGYSAYNIDSIFHQLNKLSIVNKWLLVVHDFSGSSVNLLATYLDEYIGDYLDHIVYGLDLRIDQGCYIDLSKITLELMSNNELKVYNPYFGNNKNYTKEITMACKLQDQMVDEYLKRKLVEIVRVYDKVKSKRMNCRNIRLFGDEFRFACAIGHVNFAELIGKGNFEEIEEQMLAVIEKFLIRFSSDNHKKNIPSYMFRIMNWIPDTAVKFVEDFRKETKSF